ncbi:hypothetical protein EDD18DRAFT_1163869 [Armillaria luteobubalina]|uniref:Uncharacterized protein n=1 Tax=Armillaria luteobubalina TaxID=153913 RepID=A0AA39UTJ0_9AGAR|nr:hypothetical protein EDD18DRAFT_1163869 [Armillaria luteobubalina]
MKTAEVHSAVPWNAPNGSMAGIDTSRIEEQLPSLSVQHPGMWTGQGDNASDSVAIEHSVRSETQFSSTQGASARNGQTFRHAQRIQPDDVSFSGQKDTRNGQPVRHGAAMMVGRGVRPNVRFLETYPPPLVSPSVQDHAIIWRSDHRISGQRLVSGGLFFGGLNESNIWAPQRGEYLRDRWFARQGDQIASRTSLRIVCNFIRIFEGLLVKLDSASILRHSRLVIAHHQYPVQLADHSTANSQHFLQ